MEKSLGEMLVQKKLITDEQLEMALDLQRKSGGRIGQKLIELKLISEKELASFFEKVPPIPHTAVEAELELPFIAHLIVKHAMFMGDFTLMGLADKVTLPPAIVEKAIELLRRDHLVEVKGAAQLAEFTYNFALTDRGKSRGADLLNTCRYVGPAPVSLAQYRKMVLTQTIKSVIVKPEILKEAFSHLIVNEQLLRRLGPAVSSGRTIFLYGPPGNGKTVIAETLGGVLPDSVYVPHALTVGGEIITVFDPVNHIAVASGASGDGVDRRWVLIKRPVIMVGGELTLDQLDLKYNTVSRFYEAPLQMKANNGLFIVDDFGRQQMDPQRLLNRWIVPLERRTEFFTLHTGMKFEVPFDQLTIFSTNINPGNLVDEAFLRRIRYKMKIDHPTLEEYEKIFQVVCEKNGIPFQREVFEYLIDNHYKRCDVKLNACHPRDIIDHIIDDAHHHGHAAELSKEAISNAWDNYFVAL